MDSRRIGVRFPTRVSDFSVPHSVQTGSWVHPASYPGVPRAFTSGAKRSRYEAHHSPPSSAKFKNVWSYTIGPPYVFMVRCLISTWTNLSFLLLHFYNWSPDSVVGIATGYEVHDRGVRVRVPVGSRIFSSPRHPDRLWGPASLLPNGYRG
jgi:hypothetical protein